MPELLRRVLNMTVAGLLLLLAAPVLGIGSLLVFLSDGTPVLYRQPRVGRGGEPFSLLKLRTMRLHELPPEEIGQVAKGHPLVLPIGRILRRLKVDELPQLLNVLKGDMALIGPRPALPFQVAQYDDFERRRLEVRPGMTGWAQIKGNVRLSWEERIALDVWYIDHRSLWLELMILAATVRVIVLGERRDLEALQQAEEHADRTDRSG